MEASRDEAAAGSQGPERGHRRQRSRSSGSPACAQDCAPLPLHRGRVRLSLPPAGSTWSRCGLGLRSEPRLPELSSSLGSDSQVEDGGEAPSSWDFLGDSVSGNCSLHPSVSRRPPKPRPDHSLFKTGCWGCKHRNAGPSPALRGIERNPERPVEGGEVPL